MMSDGGATLEGGVGVWGWFMLGAFFSGSIPFALLIGWSRGIDIRKHGSGNIGATNVARVLGRPAGLLCFVLDVLKGFAPALGAGLATGLVNGSLFDAPIAPRSAWLWLGVMALAVLGHIFSPWVGFRGGKGVATGLGATLGVFPYLTVPAAGAALVWVILAKATRYVSVASIGAAAALPVLVWAWGLAGQGGARTAELFPFCAATGALAALVIWRHRANIGRLMAGTENSIDGGRRGSA